MDEELRERLVSSRVVFEGRLLTVQVDSVELADGSRAEREVVRHPGAVAIVALVGDDQVVMIRQYRHAAGEVLWELPAGVLMPGEEPAACARRELVEEVGYQAGEVIPVISVFPSPGFSSEIIHVFVARELRPVERRAEPDERIAVEVLPLGEAAAMALRGEVRNAAAVCGLLAVAEWRRGEGKQELAPAG